MYYLYSKKPSKREGDGIGAEGPTDGGPVTVHSQSSRPLYGDSTTINAEEGSSRASNGEAPEGGRGLPRLNRRRPGAESESDESKDKDEQLVRRMMRRRGLEENDFTEDVMQPRRPQRMACQRCQNDIAMNDNQHRIMCNNRDRHAFCKSCVVNYVEGWVRGDYRCELIENKVGPSRGIRSLPCLAPACQRGCFPEAHMQLLIPHQAFVDYRQRSAQLRSEERTGRSLEAAVQPSYSHHQQQQQQHQPQQQAQTPQLHRHSYNEQQQQLEQQQQMNISAHEQLYQIQQYQHQQQQAELLQHQYQHQQQQYQLMQRQQLLQERVQQQQLLDQQQHNMLQDYHQDAPPPLPPSLRRTSSASTCKTTTTKSVRFSIKDALSDVVDDSVSVASSNSSLTTRFPGLVPHHQEPSSDEGSGPEEETHPQETPFAQHEQPQPHETPFVQQEQPQPQNQNGLQVVVNSNMVTCQCCYEDFDSQCALVTSCNPKQPGGATHTFCGKCFRLYIEEWLFGAASYSLRPIQQGKQSQTTLVLPCLFGDCKDGGFSDKRVSESLSPRMASQYLEKIASLRVVEEEQEDKLVKMAIRMSLEQGQIEQRVTHMLGDHQGISKGGIMVAPPPSGRRHHLPPEHVHMTNLSATSSLTSFNTAFQHTTVSAPVGTGQMKYMNSNKFSSLKKQPVAESHTDKLEKCVHDVEEAMTQAKVRQCPNCNTKFLKDKDFCNKLKCPSCKTAICYVCRHVIPHQGYEHFCIHKQGGCGDCLGRSCPLWTVEGDDDRRDLADMRARGLDEANRIWEQSLLDGLPGGGGNSVEIRVDVDKLMENPHPPFGV